MNVKAAVLTIFVLAVIPRLILALAPAEKPAHDDIGYDDRAMSILKDGIFGVDQKPTAYKPPFYSFFLAVIYGIFGHSYLAVRIIQSMLGAITCIIIYFIAFELVDKNVALVSGFLAATNLSFIKSTKYLLPELFFTFLFALMILVLARLHKKPNLSKRLFLGLLLGLSTLTRVEMVFFLPFLYMGWFSLVWMKRYPWGLCLKNLLVTLGVFLLIISIWTFRNWRLYHAFIPFTTSAGMNIYSSYCPPKGKLFGFNANDEIVKSAQRLNSEAEQNKILLKESLKFIRGNLNKIPRLELLKFLFFWSIFDWEIIGNGVYNASFVIMLPFFIWAFMSCIKKWQQYLLLYIPILYYQCTTLLFYGSPRFRIPAEPFIIIFAAMGIAHFFRKFSNRIVPSVIFAAFVFVNLAAYFYSPLLKESIKCILVKTGVW